MASCGSALLIATFLIVTSCFSIFLSHFSRMLVLKLLLTHICSIGDCTRIAAERECIAGVPDVSWNSDKFAVCAACSFSHSVSIAAKLPRRKMKNWKPWGWIQRYLCVINLCLSCNLFLFINFLRCPTYMSAYLYFTTESFLLLLFRHLISELTEWNSAISGQMVGHKRNLKTHVQYLGYPLPIQIGGPKTTFWGRLRTLTLMAYVFGVKHDICKRASALQATRISYIVPKWRELWSTNGFKLEVSFCPPSINSASHFIARLCRWRSANGTQPTFAKRWTVGGTNNLP